MIFNQNSLLLIIVGAALYAYFKHPYYSGGPRSNQFPSQVHRSDFIELKRNLS